MFEKNDPCIAIMLSLFVCGSNNACFEICQFLIKQRINASVICVELGITIACSVKNSFLFYFRILKYFFRDSPCINKPNERRLNCRALINQALIMVKRGFVFATTELGKYLRQQSSHLPLLRVIDILFAEIAIQYSVSNGTRGRSGNTRTPITKAIRTHNLRCAYAHVGATTHVRARAGSANDKADETAAPVSS